MSDKKQEIRDLFATHGVVLSQSDVWAVQGTPVVKHSALERLAAKLKLTWDPPREVMVSMNEIVILARATRTDGISEWSYGEVNVVRDGVPGGNYRLTGKQAGYPWAMAEKRAKDRVIIKLAGLHGAYSEDEAEGFNSKNADPDEAAPAARRGRPARTQAPKDEPQEDQREVEVADADPHQEDAGATTSSGADDGIGMGGDDDDAPVAEDPGAALKGKIDRAKTINAVTDLMLDPDTQKALAEMAPGIRDAVRDHAKQRLVSLGWPAKRTAAAAS